MERKMIDIHMHIVPGVDDGAMDLEMALSMLFQAHDQGVRAVFATPHSSAFDHFDEKTRENYLLLQRQATRFLRDMELYPGCEVYCEPGGMDTVLEALASGRFPAMNGTKYVLAEFSPWVAVESALACAEALVHAGWNPIIAHMERYARLQVQMALVDALREMGCLIQVNAYSVFDEMDCSIKNWARQLVAERKVDFLGTDAHRTNHRPPSAQHGLDWLYANHEKEYIDAIAWANAQKLLLNQ